MRLRIGKQHILQLILAFFPLVLWSQELSERTKALDPNDQLAQFDLLDGFVIELVASEEDGIVNPIDLTFDDAGRLWTQTARMYPMDPVSDIKWQDLLALMDDEEKQKQHPAFKKLKDRFEGKVPGEDQILILDGIYPGEEKKVEVWQDNLTIPMSILPYKNGAFVAQGSELFYLIDTDDDGKADQRVPLLTGFGFTDTHTMAHTLIKGPNHWVHFSHGALNKGNVRSLTSDASARFDFSKIGRFTEDGKKIEVINAGLNNIWGLQLRNNGLWYGIEANDLGYSVVPMQPGMAYPGIGNDRLRPYQPFVPKLHSFRVGGTGLSGLAFSDDTEGSFPAEYDDVAFLANPITSTINMVRIVRHEDGSIEAEHLQDLLRSSDDWFRPVNMEFGPDGCLYIADWYNKIVSHNEVATTHPDRDKSHGRIWRIRHVSQEPRAIPDFYKMATEELPTHLRSPSLWARRAAWSQIAERPSGQTRSLIPRLVEMVKDETEDEYTRIHALWSLESLGHYDRSMVETLLGESSQHLQREAIRTLIAFSPELDELVRLTKPFLTSWNPEIRAQVLRTLGEVGSANQDVIRMLISACQPELPGNEMGGSYERRQERYLARRALEQYSDQLYDYLISGESAGLPTTNKLWAMLALPDRQKEAVFPKIWSSSPPEELDASTFIGVLNMTDDPVVYQKVEQLVNQSGNPERYIRYALDHQSRIQSGAVGKLFKRPVLTMLQSDKEERIMLALESINKLDVEGGNALLLDLFKQTGNRTITDGVLKALANKAAENKEVFASVAGDKEISFETRSAALNILSKADKEAGGRVFRRWWPSMSSSEKQEMITIYSSSKTGSLLLLDAIDAGTVKAHMLTMPIVERMNHLSGDPRSEALLSKMNQKADQKVETKQGSQKVEKFVLMTEKTKGVASNGKVLFTTCLLCHQVGDQGQDIAPALDGSAYRDTRALLTAILEPDEAVESGYYVYRVTKKDDSVVEGYMYEKNAQGTTIAFMGGTKTFIPKADIAKEGFLTGRSFMPSGLIEHYSAQQVADLVAYIKTLK